MSHPKVGVCSSGVVSIAVLLHCVITRHCCTSCVEDVLQRLIIDAHKHFPHSQKEAKLCSVEKCQKKAHARGLCQPHYKGPCSRDGCTTTAHSRGVCKKHDYRSVGAAVAAIKTSTRTRTDNTATSMTLWIS